MSTNSECRFLVYQNQWYYLLEDSCAPKNSWDWREYAKAYGPFASMGLADKHLSDNHANPGGFSVDETNIETLTDPVMIKLIADAPANTMPPRRDNLSGFRYRGFRGY